MMGRVVWTWAEAATTLLCASSCWIRGGSLSNRMSALPMAEGPKRLPPLPGKMVSMLEPMFWMRAMEAFLEPWPMPIMAMTAPTPMMMPSMVRKARVLFRVMANSASLMKSRTFMTGSPEGWGCAASAAHAAGSADGAGGLRRLLQILDAGEHHDALGDA